VLTALLVLGADAFSARENSPFHRRWISSLVACAGCGVAAGWALLLTANAAPPGGMIALGKLAATAKAALAGLTLFTLVLSAETRFTRHFAEYCAIVLLATVGMMLLVSASDLLMVFLALELTSVCLYVLAGFDKDRATAAEAALKYFLVGGVSAACTLFGMSLLYGLSGSTQLDAVSAALTRAFSGGRLDPLAAVALVLTAAGFAFKIAAAPFHFWAPDVYQGAPTPSAALIASGSKVAGFLVLGRLVWAGGDPIGGGIDWGWTQLIALLAVASMVLGNLAALVQSSLRRLVAFSAIAHGGYALIGVLAGEAHGGPALLYYVVTYAVAALGAFGVVHLLEQEGLGDDLKAMAGLGQRAPMLSACLLVFLLSLAGIPPLAGFFGKFFVFSAALQPAVGRPLLVGLVLLALAASAVSLYYYLRVLKLVYVVAPTSRPESPRPGLTIGLAVVALLALGTVVLGIWPGILLPAGF
jgi:NADH-quinone oxidoreductase subunit N